ncbi:thioredoxin-like protein, partial [Ramicandelaber brevisporus]
PVIVDFSATWCPPCKVIAKPYETLAKQTPNVLFAKVTVDEATEIAAAFKIRAMPTFQVYFYGEKIDELIGAALPPLKAKVEQA